MRRRPAHGFAGMAIEHSLIAKLAERMWQESSTHAEAVAIGCALCNRVQDSLLGWHQIAVEAAREIHREVNEALAARGRECAGSAEARNALRANVGDLRPVQDRCEPPRF